MAGRWPTDRCRKRKRREGRPAATNRRPKKNSRSVSVRANRFSSARDAAPSLSVSATAMASARRSAASSKRAAAEALPNRRNHRVGFALVSVVFFAESRAHRRLLGFYPSLPQYGAYDERQDCGDRRPVDEWPSERHQECAGEYRMPDVAIEAAPHQYRTIGAPARSEKSKLNARTQRQPHPQQFEQQSERADERRRRSAVDIGALERRRRERQEQWKLHGDA